MKNVLCTVMLLCFAFAQAQLSGTLYDDKKEPIAFASIYVEGTYIGTTTNNSGQYTLTFPENGTYNVVFKSLGYKTQVVQIVFNDAAVTKDITLTEELTTLDAVVITNGEDPAYRIIREAINNREANRKKFSSYTADFYSRGFWYMDDVPEKFLGKEIGDLDGSLDSLTRSGIVYLSETVSEIAYDAPDNFKERIVASKVSGDDNGFSVNSAESANFDFYNNNIDLNNRIVSPIADYALGYYEYKLLGTFYDDNNFLINKIEVSSRRPKDNTFNGTIYIVEDDWTIYGVELTTRGENINVPIIEELVFNQSFTYEEASGDWIKRSQSIDFQFAFFGFKGYGRFIANYTNYDFKPQFDKKYFGPEVLSFADGANKKDSTYWNAKRPTPLTVAETDEYVKKDSISAVRNDPKYKDSVDAVNNKLDLLEILTGYTYRNSNNRSSIGYKGVTDFKGFNTVQGYVLGTGLFYSKGYDEDYNKYLYASVDADYGFSDDRVRYNASIYYRFNRTNRRSLRLSGGTAVQQINNSNPISTMENTLSSLLFERNYAKFYEVDYARASYSEELINGLFANAYVGYERRQPLTNTTDQVFFSQSDVDYTRNNPLQLDNSRLALIDEHEMVKVGLGLTIRPGQKFQSYPDQKYNINNEKYPTITLNYEGALASDNSNYDYHQFRASLYQSFDMGNVGRSSYWVNGGTFINGDGISFLDYQHFNGNRLRYKLQALNPYGFGLLNYYDYSTNSDYAQVHLQHDFKGFILGKIPGLNKLNYDLILSGKALFTDRKPYFEASAGIDNIGFGKFRPFRVDYVHSITSGRSYGAFVVGINFGL
ncbi:outer membrane protein [Flavobacteria bacterium BBFL7]|nr:outer membrane protein [Flavobacteria bacterium BBFL7]